MSQDNRFDLVAAQTELGPILGSATPTHEEVGEIMSTFRELDPDGQEFLFSVLVYEANLRISWLWEIVSRTTG